MFCFWINNLTVMLISCIYQKQIWQKKKSFYQKQKFVFCFLGQIKQRVSFFLFWSVSKSKLKTCKLNKSFFLFSFGTNKTKVSWKLVMCSSTWNFWEMGSPSSPQARGLYVHMVAHSQSGRSISHNVPVIQVSLTQQQKKKSRIS